MAETQTPSSSTLFELAAKKATDDAAFEGLLSIDPDATGMSKGISKLDEIKAKELDDIRKKLPIPSPEEVYQLVKADSKSELVIKVEPKNELIAAATPIITETKAPQSSINPNAQIVAAREARQAMVDLVEKLTSSLMILTKSDRTEIQISLQHPPLFAGSSLMLTEFNSSKNQFNLTFFNLSPDARNLIANTQNQDMLRTALVEKGYTLQLVTIEPKLDVGITTEESQSMTQSDEKNKDDADDGSVT